MREKIGYAASILPALSKALSLSTLLKSKHKPFTVESVYGYLRFVFKRLFRGKEQLARFTRLMDFEHGSLSSRMQKNGLGREDKHGAFSRTHIP